MSKRRIKSVLQKVQDRWAGPNSRQVERESTPSDDIPTDRNRIHSQGNAYFNRFERFGNLRDLEQSIASFQRVVDLTPDSHPKMLDYLNNLGAALLTRFEEVGSPADLEAAILQNRKAVDLTPDGHHEHPRRLSNLGNALEARFDRYGSIADLEEAISQKRRAVDLTPDDQPSKPIYHNNLGNALQQRFNQYGSLKDVEEALLHKQAAVSLTPDDHEDKPMYVYNLGITLLARFDRHGSLAELEGAIAQKRKAVDLTPDDHPDKPLYLSGLGDALITRFERRGILEDLEEAILQMQKGINLTPERHPSKPLYHNRLGGALERSFDRHGLLTDLGGSISHQQRAINLTPDGHPDKPAYLNGLGNALEKKFLRDKALLDLENSILRRRQAVHLMPHGHRDRETCLNNLSRVLAIRFRLLGDQNDLQAALSAAKSSAESLAASSKLRLRGALLWADCCALGSRSSLPAFEWVIKLLPRMAWLGLAVDDQYYLLAEVESAAREAVAAAIKEKEYTVAMEWAEQGRSIVWQNLLSLRTPLEKLEKQYPELAPRLQQISQQLERPTETLGVSESQPRVTTNDPMTLATERDNLIEEIRTKPGFGSFMKPKSFEELAPAAREGPVVLLNLGRAQCDALALHSDIHSNTHVVPISLERVTLQNTEELSKKLTNLLSKAGVRARDLRKHKVHGESENKDAIFKDILRTLWLDYVKPIIDGLAYNVNLDSPPRLWWCTTGPSAFLPLHAAGLYDVEEAGHKLSDYVVSSYTPTLGALLDEPSSIISDDFKVLTVAISNTPGAPLPCTEEETQKLQYLAANYPMVNLINAEATQERVLEELETSTWAHLACHGEQVGGKPMESGLILHDGKLELSKIAKARLPRAEFAFLSACQTAVGDGGVPEESAHLAAGMLFAGYRGVVATMWSIQDDIAPRVAEDFYRYMFRHGQPRRAEAAYALHRAMRSLQESKVAFTSWVPFIHIGR